MSEQGGGISAWIQQHMTLVLLLVGGLVVGVLFLKKPSPGASSTAQSAQADLSGLATDANGHPIVYRDVQDTFINISKIQGSYNNTTQPTASASSPAPSSPAGPIEHPIEPGLEGFIRSRYNSNLTKTYDTSHAQGIPIRKTPGGDITGYIAYGSDVDLKSSKDYTGPSNLSKDTGSTKWFMTSNGGYVSAYDITGFVPG